MPVFIGLAEELAADGFTARAIAALKRVEKLQPGRPDLEARIASLARHAQAPSRLPGATPPPAPPPRPTLEIGIEEVSSDTLSRLERERVERTLRLAEEKLARGRTAASGAAGEVSFELVGESPREPPPAGAAPAPEPSAGEPVAAVEPAPAAIQPATAGVANRLRGVFRRFLAGLPTTPPGPGQPPAPEPTAAEPPTEALGTAQAEPPVLTSRPEAPAESAEPAGPPTHVEPTEPVEPTPVEGDAPPKAGAAAPRLEPPRQEAPEEELPTLEIEEDLPPEKPGEAEDEVSLPAPELIGVAPEELAAAVEIGPGPATEAGPETEEPVVELTLVESEAAGAESEPASVESLLEPIAAEAEPLAGEAEAVTLGPEVLVVEPEGAAPEAPPAASRPAPAARPAPAGPAPRAREAEMDAFLGMSEDLFQDHVADLIEEMLVPGAESAPAEEAPPARPILTGPLFEGLDPEERVALVSGLKLRTFEPGDVILTEGEAGGSFFLLTAGAVKVFVRDPTGHNRLLDSLAEGDFFGEISTLSGRPRTATVTASALCELLELDRPSLAEIAARYPHVSERLEEFSRQRAGDPEAAALRTREPGAGEASLESHFDDARWEPRSRLRLADAFLKAGLDREAVQVLIDLADDMVRRGQNEKAVALLKKVEQLHRRPRGAPHRPGPAAPAPSPSDRRHGPGSDDRLREWLIDVVRDTVQRRTAVAARGLDAPAGQPIDPETLRAYGRGLVASPLFEGLSEDELLAVVRGLELRMFDPGDVILTEGEPGESVFIVANGEVKVSIRNRSGHDVLLCPLGEGAFFGEISALSGRPRTATVTAAAPCALLELDRGALEAIARAHPRVREMLENVYIERAGDAAAEAIRGQTSAEAWRPRH